MARKIVLVLLAVGLLCIGGARDGVFVSTTHGAQWYPFYGYHRPSYLDGPCAATTRSAVSQRCASAEWLPFYGYNRPGNLYR